jgi:ABC-2 type transport system permease protein
MNHAWVIAKREFRAYFDSPIAYVSITVFLVITGVLFFLAGEDFFQANQASLRKLFEWVPLVFVFYLPAVSMRLLSDERRSGTIELLVTMPVRDSAVILGKYLASLGFLLVTLLLTLPYPIIVAVVGAPDWGPIVGGYFGLLLIGAVFLAVGLMTSAWTQNQIIAFVLALIINGFFYFVDRLIGAVWEGTQDVFSYLSFQNHFQNISRGVIDTRDLVFYLSLIVVAVMIASWSLASRRWKG